MTGIATLVMVLAVGGTVAFTLTWECIRFASERIALLERTIAQMVTREEFDAAKLAAATALNDLGRRVAADLAARDAALQALRDQLAAGAVITDQDLADVQAFTLNAAAIDPAPPSA